MATGLAMTEEGRWRTVAPMSLRLCPRAPPDENLRRMMAWMFKVRVLLLPRERILAEINIKPGLCLLDYG